jgi:hypothetical protein
VGYRRKGMNPKAGLEESSKHISRLCKRKGTMQEQTRGKRPNPRADWGKTNNPRAGYKEKQTNPRGS